MLKMIDLTENLFVIMNKRKLIKREVNIYVATENDICS